MRTVKLRLGRDGSDDEIAAEMGIALARISSALVEIAGIRLLQIDDFDEGADDRLQAADDQDAALDRSRMMLAALADVDRGACRSARSIVVSLYYEQEFNMDEVGEGSRPRQIDRVPGARASPVDAAFGALGGWSDRGRHVAAGGGRLARGFSIDSRHGAAVSPRSSSR